MADTNRELFDDLLISLKDLPKLEFNRLADRLHYKTRHVSAFKSMTNYIADVNPYPSDDTDTNAVLAGVEDCTSQMERMGCFCMVIGVATTDYYQYDFEWICMALDCMGYEMYGVWSAGTIRPLMPLLFAEHIERRISKQDTKSLYALAKVPGFAEFFMQEVQTKAFAGNVRDTDATTGDHLFSIATLLIADYLHYGTFRPSLSQAFDKDRPAYQILAKWSQYSWETEDDDDGLERTMVFCGCCATVMLTVWEQPQLASLALSAFYEFVLSTSDDDVYKAAIRDGLERMDIAGIIDSWQSFPERLFKSFFSDHYQKWKSAVHTAYKKDSNAVYKWFRRYNAAGRSLPGTEVELAGQFGLVEDLAARNEYLLAVLDISQLDGARDGRVQMSAVGFNDEKLFATASQIFHTTTGLRAVDPEIARACNPYARIEPLRVGHVLYRVNRAAKNSGHETVEIKSMQVEPLSKGKLYGVSVPQNTQSFHANGYLVAVNDPIETLQSTTEALRSLPEEKRLSCLASLQELNPLFGKYELQVIHERLNLELFGAHQVGEEKPISSSEVFPKISSPSQLIKIMRDTPRGRSNGAPIDKLERTFTLTPAGGDGFQSGYQLPELSVVDGYVLADGEPQLNCTINSSRRTFQWTRQLASNSFEHGVLKVHSHGLSGRGVVLLSSSPEPSEVSSGDICHFQAMKKDAELEIDDESHSSRSAGSGQFVITHHVNMTYDKAVWPADMERNQPDSPIPGMEVRTGIYRSSSGAEMPYSKIRALDDLRTVIKTKLNRDLGSLYDCHHSVSLAHWADKGTVSVQACESDPLYFRYWRRPQDDFQYGISVHAGS